MTFATVIISVYRDAGALSLILQALTLQSTRTFEVIVSQDGDDPTIAALLHSQPPPFPWRLFTQEDNGFRKNRALNRAVASAAHHWIIFIDGDCIPHRHFVAAHLHHAAIGRVSAGRRIELGEKWSQRLRHNPKTLAQLNQPWRYLPSMLHDKARCAELALLPQGLHPLTHKRPLALLGCNFAAHRQDLIAVNGFDERFTTAGVGEDSDIDWRLRHYGIRVVNVKFSALQFHLFHPRSYDVSLANIALLKANQATGNCRAPLGIAQYLTSEPPL
ncbi:MAG: glycosyltransferase [Gammaproteobacteria bacterium]|nr:glycosyltransferase [Gammaproteobacteria bacterium]